MSYPVFSYTVRNLSLALIFAVLLSCDKSSEPAKKSTSGSPQPTRYTVAYDLQGKGAAIAQATAQDDGTAPRPANPPAAAGQAFVGWYASTNFSDPANRFDFSAKLTANTTLYAKWVDAAGYAMKQDTLYRAPLPTTPANNITVEIPYTVDNVVVRSIRGGEENPKAYNNYNLFGAYDNATVSSVIIPETVEGIVGQYAFNRCNALARVSIPDRVTFIGPYAFADCKALKEVRLPAALETISNGAFYNCESLTNTTLPSKLTYIGFYAFNQNKALTKIVIPASVNTIDDNAFSNCSNLVEIRIEAAKPPVSAEGSYYSKPFDGYAAQLKISVPSASVDAYKQADGWKELQALIEGY